jgi:DNA-binding transcriptional LysR family regulator
MGSQGTAMAPMSAREAAATMSAIPFTHLETFLAVARLRSFSNAARELGVSRSAVSQSVQQLERQLRVGLVARTTRSVALTDAGARLMESVAPAMVQVSAALTEVAARPGETVGRVRLSVPRMAIPLVMSILPTFRERHPRIEVDVAVDDRFVDLVAEGYDAGVRLTEAIERDMVQLRLTAPFRFVVVGAPEYLARRGVPERPKDLLDHECLTFRSQTTGALYAWELERGRKSYRVPVRAGVVTNDGQLALSLAEDGLGLAYAFEPMVLDQVKAGRLKIVLERYAPTVPGFFLYYPSRAQRSGPLRLFVATAKELGVQTLK